VSVVSSLSLISIFFVPRIINIVLDYANFLSNEDLYVVGLWTQLGMIRIAVVVTARSFPG